MGFLHDDCRSIAHAYDNIGKKEVPTSLEKGIGNFTSCKPANDSADDSTEKKEPSHFVDIKVKLLDAQNDGSNGKDKHQKN